MTTTMTATAARFTFDGSEIAWKQFRALEGEHHVFEPLGGGQFRHVARKAGTWATSDGDNVHYESGGEAVAGR